MGEVLPHLAERHRSVFIEAMADLDSYNLLQPPPQVGRGAGQRPRSKMSRNAMEGIKRRTSQWQRMSGYNLGQAKALQAAALAVAGAVAGWVFGMSDEAQKIYEGPLISMTLSLALGAVAGYAARFFTSSGSYYTGMLQVIVNERWSVIQPERVTAQAEIYIPKALLSWRAQDWQYNHGHPFLWLMLPQRVSVEMRLKHTLDYLMLPVDGYRAKNAAVYSRRNMNRILSATAEKYAEVEAPEEDEGQALTDRLPFFLAGGIVLAAVIMFVLMLD